MAGMGEARHQRHPVLAVERPRQLLDLAVGRPGRERRRRPRRRSRPSSRAARAAPPEPRRRRRNGGCPSSSRRRSRRGRAPRAEPGDERLVERDLRVGRAERERHVADAVGAVGQQRPLGVFHQRDARGAELAARRTARRRSARRSRGCARAARSRPRDLISRAPAMISSASAIRPPPTCSRSDLADEVAGRSTRCRAAPIRAQRRGGEPGRWRSRGR